MPLNSKFEATAALKPIFKSIMVIPVSILRTEIRPMAGILAFPIKRRVWTILHTRSVTFLSHPKLLLYDGRFFTKDHQYIVFCPPQKKCQSNSTHRTIGNVKLAHSVIFFQPRRTAFNIFLLLLAIASFRLHVQFVLLCSLSI
jgi:hypothetical protein